MSKESQMLDKLVPLLEAVDTLVRCEHPRAARQTSAVGNMRCTLCGAVREAGDEWTLPERVSAVRSQHVSVRASIEGLS